MLQEWWSTALVAACAPWADAVGCCLLDGHLLVHCRSSGPTSFCSWLGSLGGPWTCSSLGGSGAVGGSGCGAQALWECVSALTGVACGSLPPGSSWSPCCNKTKPPYVLVLCFLFSGSKEKNPTFFFMSWEVNCLNQWGVAPDCHVGGSPMIPGRTSLHPCE